MLRISKVALLSLLVVCVASAAFATTSRVQALAGTGNYINDDSNIFRWYGTLPSYANMVMVEAGQAMTDGGVPVSGVDVAGQAFGFTYSFGEDHWLGTWSVFVLNNSVEDGSFFLFNPLPTLGDAANLSGLSTPTTKFVFLWGNQVESLSYGIGFTRSDASNENSTTSTEDLGFTTIGGGLRVDIGDKVYGDVAVTFGIADGDTMTGFDSSTSFDLAARLFWEWLDNVTLVPYVDFATYDFSLLSDPNVNGSNGDQANSFSAGASLNFDVNTSNMLIFATELNFFHWEFSNTATGDQSEQNIRTLPKFFLALESDINSWLTTRIGATKSMSRTETKNAVGDQIVTTAPAVPGADFTWFLGAGFHLGDWDVDAVFEPDVPFRLGYWLTGANTGDPDPPIGRISGTYRF